MSEKFLTVAVFTYSSEAIIIQGRLEAEGIQTFLKDATTIDADPLVSNAIGGVKLQIFAEDEAKAKDVLNSISDFSLNDQGKEIRCPNCNSTKIYYFSNITSVKSLAAFVVGFLFGSLPFYTKYDYRCQNCKTKFDLK